MDDGEHILLRDERRYIAHPHMARLPDGTWLLVATCGPRRKQVLHPPLDPDFINIALRSRDEGSSWSEPIAVPDGSSTGAECAGLTVLADGAVLLNQWRFRWYAEDEEPLEEDLPALVGPQALRAQLQASVDLDGTDCEDISWSRGGGATTIWRSDDAGESWGSPTLIGTEPYTGGYGLRGGITLSTGEVLIPFSDVPHYRRIFQCRSQDGGATWSAPEPVASEGRLEFEEPAPIVTADGSLLMLIRENTSRTLYAVLSTDAGRTWSQPSPTGIPGYPAHLVALRDGRIAAVVGCRQPPGSIRIYLSEDDGRTWNIREPHFVADRLGTRDLGYPTAVESGNGQIFVAYYRQDHAGTTGLYGRRISL